MKSSSEPLRSNSLPPFAALRAFEAVFRLGGIRKAALSLNLNHAVVSRHIRSLESWLGVPLVTRSGNRMTLTEEGSRYHVRVSTALIDIACATEEFIDHRAKDRLRLNCVPGFAMQWLSGQLADFERRHPGYNVELKPTDGTANLLLHEADVDVRYYADDWSPMPGGKGLRYIELARPEILPVASPEIARSMSNLHSVADLLNAPLLHEEHQHQWRAWLTHNGVIVPEVLPGPLFWHAHLALAAARQGRGIALANCFLVNQDLQRGDLVEIRIQGAQRLILGCYALVARENGWSLPVLASLRHFLQAQALQYATGALHTP